MSRVYPYKNKPQPKSEHVAPSFGQTSKAKLGSAKNPARLSVQSEARKAELAAIAKAHSWACEINVDANSDENIADLTALQNKPKTTVVAAKPERNEACPCGSGKKYKKCCAL